MRHPSSFRDPSGYIFIEHGFVKRTITPSYFEQYKALKTQGVFEELISNGLLIPHTEISVSDTEIVLQPDPIPFFTYPYEWSFNQYKEAALLTLKIQKYCLERGFILKDASAFNITFHEGRAVFIDTLSFDLYKENAPWRAYKQFITHFLGPLVLAHYHGSESLQLLRNHMDGIPVKLLSSMLPGTSKLSPFLFTNIHLLAKYESKHNEDYQGVQKGSTLTKASQLKLITAMYDYIRKLKLKEATEWGNYYDKTNYSKDSFQEKANQIGLWINNLKPKRLIDVGGNDGTFVRQLNHKVDIALVGDIDNNAVDQNYEQIKKNKETHILPFVLDVLNPSPAIGFENKERDSVLKRIKDFNPQVTLALALIHHMTLSGNVPFEMSAQFFSSFSENLIIEFPKQDDSWVQRLLNTKMEFRTQFEFYDQENFESAFGTHFDVVEKTLIPNTNRILYLMKRK
ncbi:MAG: class I SAM-dependent methyltransferase [Psychroserpens sp.]|nr:class I SAM-dependent methyltransferase [Psychroserpens sp.]